MSNFFGKPVTPNNFGSDGVYNCELSFDDIQYDNNGLGTVKLVHTCVDGPAVGKSVTKSILIDGVDKSLIDMEDNKLAKRMLVGQGVMATLINLASGVESFDGFDSAFHQFKVALRSKNFKVKQVTKGEYVNFYYQDVIDKPARMVTGDEKPVIKPAENLSVGGDNLPF
jgi:hypothetical protein